jgi:hypothetical protein
MYEEKCRYCANLIVLRPWRLRVPIGIASLEFNFCSKRCRNLFRLAWSNRKDDSIPQSIDAVPFPAQKEMV